jgi:hypothetical protein
VGDGQSVAASRIGPGLLMKTMFKMRSASARLGGINVQTWLLFFFGV